MCGIAGVVREDGAIAPLAHLADAGWIEPGVPDATWNAWQRGAVHWSRPWALGMLGEFLRTV